MRVDTRIAEPVETERFLRGRKRGSIQAVGTLTGLGTICFH